MLELDWQQRLVGMSNSAWDRTLLSLRNEGSPEVLEHSKSTECAFFKSVCERFHSTLEQRWLGNADGCHGHLTKVQVLCLHIKIVFFAQVDLAGLNDHFMRFLLVVFGLETLRKAPKEGPEEIDSVIGPEEETSGPGFAQNEQDLSATKSEPLIL